MLRDNGVMLVIHLGESCDWPLMRHFWYLRLRVLELSSSHPLIIMLLSDQHPYALFVAGGLRSPSLAKA